MNWLTKPWSASTGVDFQQKRTVRIRNRYDAEERAENLEEMWEVIEEGEMPPWFYTPLHPGAKLTDGEREALRAWLAAAPTGGPPSEDEGHEEEDDDG